MNIINRLDSFFEAIGKLPHPILFGGGLLIVFLVACIDNPETRIGAFIGMGISAFALVYVIIRVIMQNCK